MSKKKEGSRKDSPQKKQKESAIYRKLELLTVSLMKRTSNVPNVPMVSELVRRLANELADCLTVIAYAYNTIDLEARFEYLSSMKTHIRLITTIVNLLLEYASLSSSRFMTPDQHAKYLIDLEDIESQRAKWEASTLRYLSASQTSTNENISGPNCTTAAPPPPEIFSAALSEGGSKRIDYSVPENVQFMKLGPDRVIIDESDTSCCEDPMMGC